MQNAHDGAAKLQCTNIKSA